MQISELAARGLDNTDFVRLGVVSAQQSVRQFNLSNTRGSIRVAASVCQSVGRHVGGNLA